MNHDVFVVPLKQFDIAKDRLRRAGTASVTDLARTLAAGVLNACAPRPVIVVSESEQVTTFAREHGADVFESGAENLSQAIQSAYEGLADRFERLIIVHGDLRDPEGLGAFFPAPGITIITDHHGRGTNILVVPTGLNFRFAYGANSAERHRREALRVGVFCHYTTQSPWCYDVDEPEDLE